MTDHIISPVLDGNGNPKTITIDESFGLNNSGVPILLNGLVVEDNNDDDVLFDPSNPSTVPFSDRLFGATELNIDPFTVLEVAHSDGDIISISTSGTVTNLALTDDQGAPLVGAGSDLYVGSDQVFLYTDTENDNIVLGLIGNGDTADPNGPVAFIVMVEETLTNGEISGASAWTIQMTALTNPVTGGPTDGSTATESGAHDDPLDLTNKLFVTATEEIAFDDFSDIPPGKAAWIKDGVPNIDTNILVTAGLTPNDLVNVSTQGLGFDNQTLEYLQFLRVAPVEGGIAVEAQTQSNTDDLNNLSFDERISITGASFSPSQVQRQGPGPDTTTVVMSAWYEPDFVNGLAANNGTAYENSLDSGNEVPIAITSATVYNALGQDVTGALGVTVTISGNTVTVTGVQVDWKVEFRTDDEFNQFKIANGDSTGASKFDVGAINLIDVGGDTDEIGSQYRFEDAGVDTTVTADGTEPGVAYLFDGNQANGNFEGDNGTGAPTADQPRTGTPTSVAVDFSGVFTTTTVPDADGATDSESYALVLNVADGTPVQVVGSNGAQPLTSGGIAVDWKEVTEGSVYAGVLTGTDTEVFRLEVDQTGLVTFTQSAAWDHPRPDTASPYTTDLLTLADDQISLEKSNTATDSEGDFDTDSAFVDLGGNFGAGDDGPTADVNADGTEPGVAYLFDGNQANGNFEGDNGTGVPTADQPRTGAPTSVTVGFAVAFTSTATFGADGGSESTTYALDLGVAEGTQVQVVGVDGLQGLTSGGIAVDWKEITEGSVYAGVLTGTDTEVFRLEVDQDGDVTFTQSAAWDHPREDNAAPYTTDLLTLADGQISVERSLTATDGDNDTATDSDFVDLGGNFGAGDDGPAIGPIADGLVDFAAGSSVSNPLGVSIGADQPGDYVISSSPATLTIFDGTDGELTLLRDIAPDGKTVTYFNDADLSGTLNEGDISFFELSLSGNTYTFDVLEDPPPVQVGLDFNAITGGGQQLALEVPTIDASFDVVFDGLYFPDGNATTPSTNPDDFTNDLVLLNPDNLGFGVNSNGVPGVSGDQSSQHNGQQEGWFAFGQDEFGNPLELLNLDFGIQGVGNINDVDIQYWLVDDGVIVEQATVSYIGALPSGNNEVRFIESNFAFAGDPSETPLSDGDTPILQTDDLDAFDFAFLRVAAPQGNQGVRLQNFTTALPQPTPDELLEFTVMASDLDNDTAFDGFKIGIDGTGEFDDGIVAGIA